MTGTANAGGGGVSVSGNSRVVINSTRFIRTRADLDTGVAFGGGIAVQSGDLRLNHVSFLETSVSSGTIAYGGGVGASGGTIEVYDSTWTGSSATSGGQAWGGGDGSRFVADTTIYDSTMSGCSANADGAEWGAGGSVCTGTLAGGNLLKLSLLNVTLVDSLASNSSLGRILFEGTPRSIVAAKLTIRDDCSVNGTNTRLIGTFNEGTMRIRDLTIDAPDCEPLAVGTLLEQCDEDTCGRQAECKMSEPMSDEDLRSPLCECNSNPLEPFKQPVPSDDVRRPELAPYTSGCTVPPRQQRAVKPNLGRLSEAIEVNVLIHFVLEHDLRVVRVAPEARVVIPRPGAEGAHDALRSEAESDLLHRVLVAPLVRLLPARWSAIDEVLNRRLAQGLVRASLAERCRSQLLWHVVVPPLSKSLLDGVVGQWVKALLSSLLLKFRLGLGERLALPRRAPQLRKHLGRQARGELL